MDHFLDSIAECETLESDCQRSALSNKRKAAIARLNQKTRSLVHVVASPSPFAGTTGQTEGLLSGVPIAVKDLIDVSGMPTRAGSRAVMRIPEEHAAVIQALLDQGAVIAGKSHTTEFAMSGWGVGPLGRPLNPIDASDTYHSGGSSNGSASAVATGLVPAALGTDTGGSVRIPSSWCGITGLKGSPGWVSTQGVMALSQSFDVVGPMARTASDVCRLYRAMLPAPRRAALEQNLRVAARAPLPALIFMDDASLGDIDPAVLAAYRASQSQCESLGFTVSTDSIPCRFTDMAQNWAGISEIEGYLNNQALADDPNAPLEDAARSNLLRKRGASLDDYLGLLNQARLHRDVMECFLLPDRILVVPTTSTPAVRLTEFDPARTLGIYTRFVNLIQGCAIAVPNGETTDGRPTSMQFIGSYGRDADILSVAMRWQENTDWHDKLRERHRQQMQQLQA